MEEVQEAVSRVEQEVGPIDVLVANAGVVNPPTLMKEGTIEVSLITCMVCQIFLINP